MPGHVPSVLDFIRDDQTIAASTYIILLAIVTMRVRAGYFPTRTRWFALFGLLGFLNLFLKYALRLLRGLRLLCNYNGREFHKLRRQIQLLHERRHRLRWMVSNIVVTVVPRGFQ